MAERTTLTPTQQRYLHLIVKEDMLPDMAYRQLYKTANMPRSYVEERVRKLAEHRLIKPVLEEYYRRKAHQTAKRARKWTITRETIADQLAPIAFSQGQVVWEDGRTQDVNVGMVRGACMDLARLFGLVAEPVRQPRTIRSVADLTDDELQALEAEAARAESPHGKN